MKKLIFMLIFMCMCFTTIAVAQQVIVIPNQKTFYWDIDPLNPTLSGTITTEVYTIVSGLDKADEANWVLQGETDQTSLAVTFTTEGQFIVGIRTKRVLPVPNDSMIMYSSMNWSDINGEETPVPFIVFYAVAPNTNKNLRVTQ